MIENDVDAVGIQEGVRVDNPGTEAQGNVVVDGGGNRVGNLNERCSVDAVDIPCRRIEDIDMNQLRGIRIHGSKVYCNGTNLVEVRIEAPIHMVHPIFRSAYYSQFHHWS